MGRSPTRDIYYYVTVLHYCFTAPPRRILHIQSIRYWRTSWLLPVYQTKRHALRGWDQDRNHLPSIPSPPRNVPCTSSLCRSCCYSSIIPFGGASRTVSCMIRQRRSVSASSNPAMIDTRHNRQSFRCGSSLPGIIHCSHVLHCCHFIQSRSAPSSSNCQ